jgi:hypothetical protein
MFAQTKLSPYYLQSLFSAPIFNWSDKGLPIANAAFKYYWAITMPLTLLVVVLWATAMLFPWNKLFSKLWPRSIVPDEGS